MQRYFSSSKQFLTLSDNDIHHIKNVMRCKISDTFEIVFDNKIHICEINSLMPFEFKVVDINSSFVELKNDVTLFYCLSKGDKNDFVVQKATELGVHKIVFLSSKRSVVRLNQNDFDKKKIRYEKIAKEAAEQSRRTIIPEIIGLYDVSDIPTSLLAKSNFVAYESESGKTKKTMDFFSEISQKDDSVSILIGSEGGLEEKEISKLEEIGFKTISLGKRILRTETAAVYALSVLGFILESK